MEAERLRVLGMLQQGRITAEQADRLLEALEQSARPPATPARSPGAESRSRSGWGPLGWATVVTGEVPRRVAGALGRAGGRANFGSGRLTRNFLSRLHGGSSYTNYGRVTIADDVPEELLDQKIAEYRNFGVTVGPPRLLRLLEDRCVVNFGHFTESEEIPAPEGEGAREMVEVVLTSFTPEDWWKQIVIDCAAGHLDFRPADGDAFRLVVSRRDAHQAGGEESARWSTERQGAKRIFTLGEPTDPAATREVTFRLEIPRGFDPGVSARTARGNISAQSLSGPLDLHSGGGDISCRDIAGDVKVDTGGGKLSFSDIAGDLRASTGGGNVSCHDISGDVSVGTGGGDLSCADVAGSVTAETGGGNVSVSDVAGDASATTGGGNIALSDIAGDARGRTGGGSVKLEEVEGDANVETGAGDITVRDVKGAVNATTGRGQVIRRQ
jgi:hypothetical protein